ncbi:hypothetical protein DT603_01015 [Pseudoxanthomonas gei]|uniref:Uncharacterized protein n=1 Tax=Pseudoxanthomonas gei TaxID=1383030 RepID=A0ABX0A7C1_9GAMM|nr:hypothetical protein [Pseudoxanthomonas gei]
MASEGRAMTDELCWEGFAWMAGSGIREALDAAGVDCVAMDGSPAFTHSGIPAEDDAHEPARS